MLNYISGKDFLKEGSRLFKDKFWQLFLIQLFILLCVIGLMALVAGIAATILGQMNPYAGEAHAIILGIVFLFFFLAIIILMPVLIAGYRYIYIKLSKNEKANFSDIFHGFSNFCSIWLTQYFKVFLIYAGSILFFIPVSIVMIPAIFVPIVNSFSDYYNYGMTNYYSWEQHLISSPYFYVLMAIIPIVLFSISIYWILKFMLSTYVAIDKKSSASDAIYYGSKMTTGYKKKMFLALILPYFLMFIVSLIISYLSYTPNFTVYDLLQMILIIFVFTPWINCIIAIIYKTLGENFNNNDSHKLFQAENTVTKDLEDTEDRIAKIDKKENADKEEEIDKIEEINKVDNKDNTNEIDLDITVKKEEISDNNDEEIDKDNK
ncbi:MAG: hypothetical protein ACOC3B_01640 [Bacillota bacterium]